MKGDWEKILSEHPDIDPDRLTAYLEGRLEGEDRHRVERQMAESDFVSDAMEGLATLPDKGRLPGIVADLNRGLRRRTSERRSRLFRNGIGFPAWLAYATVIFILLILAAWLILRAIPAGTP
ncbi:MAG: zf-HC2 domain-containing protein [Chitinophagia bacterium]|nr:zf-HC2 domain-containing protein [Chitinophagia bacterium]